MYEITTKLSNGGVLRTPAIREINTPIKTDVKSKIRYRIQTEVGDREDIIADNAKMISLLFSVISDLWEITPQEQKDLLSSDKKNLIDYGIAKFKDTTTLGDLKISKNGTSEIDTLLGRQATITTIVMDELNLK